MQAAAAQVRKNAHVEIIPLSTGCLGACTYCKYGLQFALTHPSQAVRLTVLL